MELRTLRYFPAVAEEGNISKAARRLHLTQPTLSRQLRDQEEQLGKPLFERSYHRLDLTPEGVLLKARAEEIASLAERLGKDSAQYKAAVRRLDESIEYARRLDAEGKVYSAEQWEDHDIQCQIAKPNLRNRDQQIGTYGKMNQNVADDYSTHAHYVTYSNTFFRDFFVPLLKGTNRVNWFDS